jgi:hypothetical protein
MNKERTMTNQFFANWAKISLVVLFVLVVAFGLFVFSR